MVTDTSLLIQWNTLHLQKHLSPCFVNTHLQTRLFCSISFIVRCFSLVYQMSNKPKAKQSPHFPILNICHFLRCKFVKLKKEAFIVSHSLLIQIQMTPLTQVGCLSSNGICYHRESGSNAFCWSVPHTAISKRHMCSRTGYSELCRNRISSFIKENVSYSEISKAVSYGEWKNPSHDSAIIAKAPFSCTTTFTNEVTLMWPVPL